MFALITVALGVGFACGCCGIGGFLLIPALMYAVGMDTHTAMGTALFSFIFTGMWSLWLYQRHGSIDWPVAWALCLGALPSGFLGAMHKSALSAPYLNLVLAAIIIFAGCNALRKADRGFLLPMPRGKRERALLLTCIGAGVGYLAGLTGAGGPVLAIPVLMLFGFSPLTAIGASYAVQIVGAVSGSVGNALYGAFDVPTALWTGIIQLAGVSAGVYAAHHLPAQTLRMALAVLCIAAGVYMIAGVLFM